MGVKIITDSASDLPQEIINTFNIEVIPLLVYLENEEYLDGKNINPEEIFNGMREGEIYKTAQVPPAKFREIFTKYAEKQQKCIYIAFSSGLSGTYETAVLTKKHLKNKYPDFDLSIIDTKCASTGLGLVVYKAALMANKGESKSEIIKSIKFYADHMEHIFTVDNLEYLYRGGRVSRTTAFVGGLLNIKPILDVEEGKLIPRKKVRGRKKVLNRMLEIMSERGVNLTEQTIGISHGNDINGAETLRDMIKKKFNCNKFIINSIGGAIGAHSGPGTLALFFLNKQPPIK